jgi:autotransporter-associated beta strand protein
MRRRRTRRSALGIAAVVTTVTGNLVASAARGQSSGTWAADVGTAGGSWSVASNWAGGVMPDGGGTALFSTLPTFTGAPLPIFEDLPNVTLSGITIDTYITYQPKLPAGNTTNTITLTGPAFINTPLVSLNAISSTSIGHQIQVPIAGSAGLTKTGPGTVTMYVTNTYSGGTTVEGGGILVPRVGDLTFGAAAGSITLSDGMIRVSTNAWTTSRDIRLLGDGTIEVSTGNTTTTFNGEVMGAGNLYKSGSRAMIFNASNSYTGATNVLAGSLALATAGSIRNTSALSVRDTMLIDNVVTNLADRVNDAAPVTRMGASLTYNGSPAADSSETLGCGAQRRRVGPTRRDQHRCAKRTQSCHRLGRRGRRGVDRSHREHELRRRRDRCRRHAREIHVERRHEPERCGRFRRLRRDRRRLQHGTDRVDQRRLQLFGERGLRRLRVDRRRVQRAERDARARAGVSGWVRSIRIRPRSGGRGAGHRALRALW